MNYKMISDQIVKSYYAYDKNPSKQFPIIVGNYGDKVVLAPDGYRAYIMPPDKCIFNLKSLLVNREEADFKKLIGSEWDYTDAYKTNELRVVGKNTLVKITDYRDLYAWVNVDYLKPFDKDITFKIKGRKSVVLIYKDEDLIGFVLPVYFEEV